MVPNNTGSTTYDVAILTSGDIVTQDLSSGTINSVDVGLGAELDLIAGAGLTLASGTNTFDGTLNNSGNFTTQAFTTTNINGTATNNAGGMLSFGVGSTTNINGTLNNSGIPYTAGGTLSFGLGSTTNVAGTLNNSWIAFFAGTMTLLNGSTFTNTGSVTYQPTDSQLNVNAGAVLTNNAGGNIIFDHSLGISIGGVVINNAGGGITTSGSPLPTYATGGITVLNGGTLTNNSTGNITYAVYGVTTYALDVNAGGLFTNNGTAWADGPLDIGGRIENNSMLTLDAATGSMAITEPGGVFNNNAGGTLVIAFENPNVRIFNNYGTFNNSGVVQNNGFFNNGSLGAFTSTAHLDVAAGGTWNNGLLTNNTGTMTIEGTFNNYAKLNNGSSSAVNIPAMTLTINPGGVLNIEGGPSTVQNFATFNVAGSLNILNASGLGTFLNVDSGTLTLQNGSQVTNNGVFVNYTLATVNATGGTVDNNAGVATGGGIFNNGTVTLQNSIFNNNSAAELDNGSSVNSTATFSVGSGAVFNNNATAVVNNYGAFGVGGGFFNNGAMNNFAGGTFTVSPGGTMNNGTGGGILNQGTFTLGNSAIFNNAAGAALTNQGTLAINGTVNNNGMLVSTGTFDVTPTGVVNNGMTGSITASQLSIGGMLLNNGAITMTGGNSLSVLAGGTLRGNGSIMGDVSNAGTISPGNSPGILAISGNYTQTGTGTYLAELGGLLPGQYDQLQISGNAFLDGTLNVSLVNSFAVTLGDTYMIMTYGSETGSFGLVNLPTLPSGEQWVLTYQPTDLLLGVSSSGATATPEPGTLLLTATGLSGLLWRQRRSGRRA